MVRSDYAIRIGQTNEDLAGTLADAACRGLQALP